MSLILTGTNLKKLIFKNKKSTNKVVNDKDVINFGPVEDRFDFR
jgi:hypothetical protein